MESLSLIIILVKDFEWKNMFYELHRLLAYDIIPQHTLHPCALARCLHKHSAHLVILQSHMLHPNALYNFMHLA